MNIPRDLQIALYAHTAAILNARREYEARPSAACWGTDLRGTTYTHCDQLALTGDHYCRRHRARLDHIAAAQRARRKETT